MKHITAVVNGSPCCISMPDVNEKRINGVWWRWYYGHISPSFCIVKAHGTDDEREIDTMPECGWSGKKRHKAWDHFEKWYRRHQRAYDLRIWPDLPRGRKRCGNGFTYEMAR